MKKTLIALLALAGVATAETETITLTLPSSCTATYGKDWQSVQQNADISPLLNSNKDNNAGVYVASNGNNLGNYGVNGEGTWVNTKNVGTITLCGRVKAFGDYMALVLTPTFEKDTILKSLTFNAGAISGVVNTYTLQVGVYTNDGLSYLSQTANYDSTEQGASVNLSLDNDFVWNTGDKIVAVLRAGSGDATSAYTVAGISLSATTEATAVPEPTTATLSLLALAGLAARRRRK